MSANIRQAGRDEKSTTMMVRVVTTVGREEVAKSPRQEEADDIGLDPR